MTDDRSRLRISNDDRDDAIEQLREALGEGRIDLAEFDERSKAAYEAKTNAELDLLFEDLPVDRDEGRAVQRAEPVPAACGEDADQRDGMVPALRALIWVGGMTTTIWFVTFVTTGELQYFWPLWPIMACLLGVFGQTVGRRRRS